MPGYLKFYRAQERDFFHLKIDFELGGRITLPPPAVTPLGGSVSLVITYGAIWGSYGVI